MLVAGATGGVGQLLTAKLLEVGGAGVVGAAALRCLPPPWPTGHMPFVDSRPLPFISGCWVTWFAPSLLLLQRGYKVKALSRSADKVQQLFRGAEGLSTAIADMRDASSLPAALEGVDAVVCCTGTTAFPSKRCAGSGSDRRLGAAVGWLAACGCEAACRCPHSPRLVAPPGCRRWDGGNNPEQTDLVSVCNLVRACPQGLQRFVLTTSAGVERSDKFPFAILNLFGALLRVTGAGPLWQAAGALCVHVLRRWWWLKVAPPQHPCLPGRRRAASQARLLLRLTLLFWLMRMCASVCTAGVLKYKRMAEQELEASGLPYLIVRPSRLTDGERAAPGAAFDVPAAPLCTEPWLAAAWQRGLLALFLLCSRELGGGCVPARLPRRLPPTPQAPTPATTSTPCSRTPAAAARTSRCRCMTTWWGRRRASQARAPQALAGAGG